MMRDLAPQRGRVIWQGFTDCRFLPQSLAAVKQSSGEDKMRHLTELFRENSGALFLDEPETHLDAANRAWLSDALRRHRGLVVIASHDAALLDAATLILHTEMRGVTSYRMSYAQYRAAYGSAREKRALRVDRAEHELKKSLKAQQLQLERQVRRSNNAAARAPLAGIPRIARGIMKRNAEATLGKIISRNRWQSAADTAELHALREAKGTHLKYRFEIPVAGSAPLGVHALQIFDASDLPLWRRAVSFSVKHGEKLHIAGANGAGKSMLFKTLLGTSALRHSGELQGKPGEIRLIDSSHTGIDCAATPLSLALAEKIAAHEGEARRLLGAFGFPGDAVFRPFSSLSAGEKMRLRIFLIGKSPRPVSALLSDEAETGLDTEARRLYAAFLNDFAGATLVASHDDEFMRSLGITGRVVLDTNPVIE
jgi:ATPase subunit of ABC transporter with duplicated ATPase domains